MKRMQIFQSLDVNVAADATVSQDLLAKTANVSKILMLTLQFVNHLKERIINAETAHNTQLLHLDIISGPATSVNRISPVLMEETTTSTSKY